MKSACGLQVRLIASMGLNFGRIMCCIPLVDSITWRPAIDLETSVEMWRNQAIGTSMVMAFLIRKKILTAEDAEEQV